MRRQLQAVIFDMDGLLFDTERLSAACWMQVAREFDLDIPEAFLSRVRGLTREEFRRVFNTAYGERAEYEAVMGRKTELFRQRLKRDGVPVKPGARELLSFLREEGLSTALATATKRETAEGYLSETGLERCFDVLIFGDQARKGKPDPEIFLCAAQALGVRPERCAVLEDSLNGVLAGLRGGFCTIMVPDLTQPPPGLEKKLFCRCDNLFQVMERIKGLRRCSPGGAPPISHLQN